MNGFERRLSKIEKETDTNRENCEDLVWNVPGNLKDYKSFLEKYREHFPCPGLRTHYVGIANFDSFYQQLGVSKEQVLNDLNIQETDIKQIS